MPLGPSPDPDAAEAVPGAPEAPLAPTSCEPDDIGETPEALVAPPASPIGTSTPSSIPTPAAPEGPLARGKEVASLEAIDKDSAGVTS